MLLWSKRIQLVHFSAATHNTSHIDSKHNVGNGNGLCNAPTDFDKSRCVSANHAEVCSLTYSSPLAQVIYVKLPLASVIFAI